MRLGDPAPPPVRLCEIGVLTGAKVLVASPTVTDTSGELREAFVDPSGSLSRGHL